MTPVMQTKFGLYGNCMAACVASLLEVPLTCVPQWEDMGEDWEYSLREFVLSNNALYGGVLTPVAGNWWTDLRPLFTGVGGYFIVGGGSPRGVLRGHVVIFRDGVLVHDPHPSQAGLISVVDVYLIEGKYA